MRKNIMMATLVAMIFGSSAMAADSSTTNVSLTGTVAPTCVLGTPTGISGATNASATALGGNGSSSSITLDLADTTNAQLKSSGFKLVFPNSYCNYNAYVSLDLLNKGLITTGGVSFTPGTFVGRIGYSSNVAWGSYSLTGPAPTTSTSTYSGDTAAAALKQSSQLGGSNYNDLEVSVYVAASTTPVMAGTYSDTLTLKVGAAP